MMLLRTVLNEEASCCAPYANMSAPCRPMDRWTYGPNGPMDRWTHLLRWIEERGRDDCADATTDGFDRHLDFELGANGKYGASIVASAMHFLQHRRPGGGRCFADLAATAIHRHGHARGGGGHLRGQPQPAKCSSTSVQSISSPTICRFGPRERSAAAAPSDERALLFCHQPARGPSRTACIAGRRSGPSRRRGNPRRSGAGRLRCSPRRAPASRSAGRRTACRAR